MFSRTRAVLGLCRVAGMAGQRKPGMVVCLGMTLAKDEFRTSVSEHPDQGRRQALCTETVTCSDE